MNFKQLQVDTQTLNDLNIFARSGKQSIYTLYNKTATEGGSVLLERLFKEPLSDYREINRRSELYYFFSKEEYSFPIDSENISTLGFYINNDDVRTQLQVGGQSISQRFKDAVAADPDYVFVHDGVQAALRLFHQLKIFIERIKEKAYNSPYEPGYERLKNLIQDSSYEELNRYASDRHVKLPLVVLSDLDKQIRFNARENTLQLLHLLYELDVYIAVAQVGRQRGFYFGEAYPSPQLVLEYEGVFHPHVEKAIPNNLNLSKGGNMLFLTGANMAGKSTLMKSLGICLYLAHMGFPVPARLFKFSVKDAIYTSINLADNLQQGASHYYAEVLRVKEVAQQLLQGKQLFVIFDEMFRGTNVKDAYDATVAITRAFARKPGSQFIISTHIVEAGEELLKENLGIKFEYLPTEMKDTTLTYPRVLRNGISSDRHGMLIIENESVLEILDNGAKY